MSRRRERTSSQKNRKFACPSTIFVLNLFVWIDSFQNAMSTEHGKICFGHFLQQSREGNTYYILMK